MCYVYNGHQLAIQHRLRPPLSTPEVASSDRECPRINEVRVFRREMSPERSGCLRSGYVVDEIAHGDVMKILSISLPFFDKERQAYGTMCGWQLVLISPWMG